MKTIKKFCIKSLFGRFDYDLIFEEDEGYTILAAPNGFGKSTILNIIKYIGDGNFFFVHDLDFSEIRVDWDDSYSLVIKKLTSNEWRSSLFDEAKKRESEKRRFDDEYVHNKKEKEFLKIHLQDLYARQALLASERDAMKRKEKIFRDSLKKQNEGNDHIWKKMIGDMEKIYTQYSVVEKSIQERTAELKLNEAKYANLIDHYSQTIYNDNLQKFYSLQGMECYVCSLTLFKNGDVVANRDFTELDINKVIESIDSNLDGITRVNQGYNAFPCWKSESSNNQKILRLVDMYNTHASIMETVFKDYYDFAERVRYNVQFLETDRLFGASEISDFIKGFCQQSLPKDDSRKLKLLDIFHKKMELLEEKANEFIVGAEIKVNSDGISATFKNRDDHQVVMPVEMLSSGEQQIISILGFIIFFAGSFKDRLCLIDEPEISMHPAWQELLGNVIYDFKEQYGLNFIIATHSPMFIGERWDHVIELSHL